MLMQTCSKASFDPKQYKPLLSGRRWQLPSRCCWGEGGFTKSLSGEVFVGVKLAVSSKPLSGEVWLGGRCIKDSVAQRSDFPAVERQNLP